MLRTDALQVLKQHLGHSPETALLVLRNVDAAIAVKKGVGHAIEEYPLDWFPALLLGAGEIGHTRFVELLRSDFSPKETIEDVQSLLAQAFGGMTQ